MSTEKSSKGKDVIIGMTSVKSNASHFLSPDDHLLNLESVTSQPLSINHVAEDFTQDQKAFILKRMQFDGLESWDDLPVAASFMLEKISSIELDESIGILKDFIDVHKDDVNIPEDDYDLVNRLVEAAEKSSLSQGQSEVTENLKRNLHSEIKEKDDEFISDISSSELGQDEYRIFDWKFQTRVEAGIIAYWSPYPEVRAVTDPFDDPTITAESLRMYIVALIWTAIGAFVNQFFNERQPGISLSSQVAQLFIYPCGVFLEYVLPRWKFTILGVTVDLNPGPWTYKEQMMATIMYGTAGGSSYVSSNIINQKMPFFYNNHWVTWGYQILLVLSTNFMGFGFGGLMRRFVVYPVEAVWPNMLPTLALNRALLMPEKKENLNGWTISRYSFFWIVTASSFIYYWIPGYLFGALSTFNWMTWIKPDNFNLAMITGSVGGLGFNPIPTFDWNMILMSAPLANPFYSTAISYMGSIFAFFVICAIYWTNSSWTGYLPLNSNHIFDNTGNPYQISNILTPDSLFDEEGYKKYGPPFYSAANLFTYGAFFALYPFLFLYEMGTRYKEIIGSFKSFYEGVRNYKRNPLEGFNDPHSRMMLSYKEVPEWAYTIALVISIVFAIVCVKVYPAETPVWGIFFAVAMNFVFLIPITILSARTGVRFALNVLVELIVGYAIPGNGLALNFIKALGTNIDSQAENYISNLKWGQYAKLAPRAMFRIQFIAVFVQSFINLAVVNFQINDVEDFCLPHQKQKFSCPGSNTFFSASVLWGVIGPKRVFDGLYPVLKYCFLIGFLVAIPCLIFKLYAPRKWTKYFEPTVFISGMLVFAPYNLTYYTGGLYIAIASMWYLKTRYKAFWEKYNYVFTSAITAGFAFSSVIIFFAVQYHPKNLSWWGNNVPYLGMDAAGLSLLNATASAPDGYFGPRIGHYP